MQRQRVGSILRSGDIPLLCAVAACLVAPLSAHASGYSVLHSFNGSDGAYPRGGLIADAEGNLYGTGLSGGAHNNGVVFEVSQDGSETVLYSFCAQENCADGSSPNANLIVGADDSLYGTTLSGGGTGCGGTGCGTVFKIASDGTETVLYSFCSKPNCSDGAGPFAGLIEDEKGNLYGTTVRGGNSNADYCGVNYGGGCGVVFKLARNGTETVLYSFCALENCADGFSPDASLLAGKDGSLLGTTAAGGAANAYGLSGGTVFKLARDGTETVLHSFCSESNCSDGVGPYAGLTADTEGNLYGTTEYGGTGIYLPQGGGVVFKLTPNGKEIVLYSFCSKTYCADGEYPTGTPILDEQGNIYGTTLNGGTEPHQFGTIFKLTRDHHESVLHTFRGESDGDGPWAGLIADKTGNLYGTTSGDTSGSGTVFEFAKNSAPRPDTVLKGSGVGSN